jgi:hypothetical protein
MPPDLDATNERWKTLVDRGHRVRLNEDKIALVDFEFWKRFDEASVVFCPTPRSGSGGQLSSSRRSTAQLSGPNDEKGRYACVVTTERCGTEEEGATGFGTREDPPLKPPVRLSQLGANLLRAGGFPMR